MASRDPNDQLLAEEMRIVACMCGLPSARGTGQYGSLSSPRKEEGEQHRSGVNGHGDGDVVVGCAVAKHQINQAVDS
jgi:hypothetical protein